MGFLDVLFGRHNTAAGSRDQRPPPLPAQVRMGALPPPVPDVPPDAPSGDEQALARYRYLLRTAPPEAIERVHAESFARLTPQQRAHVLLQISAAVPPTERGALADGRTDPQALARVATRAEMREPGFLERTLGGAGGMGAGAMIGTSLLGSFLASMAGSMLAQQLLSGFHGSGDGGWGGEHGVSGESARTDDQEASGEDDGEELEEDPDYDPGNLGDAGDLGDDFSGGDFGGDIDV